MTDCVLLNNSQRLQDNRSVSRPDFSVSIEVSVDRYRNICIEENGAPIVIVVNQIRVICSIRIAAGTILPAAPVLFSGIRS